MAFFKTHNYPHNVKNITFSLVAATKQTSVNSSSSKKLSNVFTPNGDGFNDSLILLGIPNGFSLMILNRGGNVVFETLFPNVEFWDGRHNGEYCAEGIYFYVAKVQIRKVVGM